MALRKLRISLLTRSLTRGGAQVQVALLANGLLQRGHQVQVVTFYSGGALEESIKASGVPVVSLMKSSRWDLIGPVRKLTQHLRQSNCQIAYSFLPLENLMGLLAARLSRVPIAWGIRGAAVGRGQYGIASRVLYGLQFCLIRRPDAIISNSVEALREIGLATSDRIHTVQNGIDGNRFAPNESQRSAFRRRLGVESSIKLVGIVARLDPMKDHQTFLEAAKLISGRRDVLRFVIAGDGPSGYRAHLMAKATALGVDSHLHWLGEVGDTSSVYNGIDIAVSSSAYGEGFSNSIGEAMACGLPVVATDVGDSANIIGRYGSVVPVRSPLMLADAILRELDADSEDLRRARRAWILGEYGVEKMIERTESILAGAALGSA